QVHLSGAADPGQRRQDQSAREERGGPDQGIAARAPGGPRRLRPSARGGGAGVGQRHAPPIFCRVNLMPSAVTLRPYTAADEAAAIELWRQTWQEAYPAMDFAARVDWWRERWRSELVPTATIVVAESAGTLVGFVTVNAATGYLDQIVVAPQHWGAGIAELLLNEAKRLSPKRLELHVNQDNTRAIRFYHKQDFAIAGDDVNARSGAPTYLMS